VAPKQGGDPSRRAVDRDCCQYCYQRGRQLQSGGDKPGIPSQTTATPEQLWDDLPKKPATPMAASNAEPAANKHIPPRLPGPRNTTAR
jgi:hypothetical protein